MPHNLIPAGASFLFAESTGRVLRVEPLDEPGATWQLCRIAYVRGPRKGPPPGRYLIGSAIVAAWRAQRLPEG